LILKTFAQTRPGVANAPLPLLDGGRFAAAALVVLFHYTIGIDNYSGIAPFAGFFRGGHAGVEYFFVLSGFIILYAHRSDIGQPHKVRSFFAKRAIRILPMLWAVLIVWGLLRAGLSGQTTRGETGLGTLLLDLLLLPHAPPYVLGVTWTLTRELVFYTLFALVIVNRRIGWSVLLLWQAGVIVYAILGPTLPPWPEAIWETHNLGFGLGLAIGLAILAPPPGRRTAGALAAAGALLFAALLAAEWRLGAGLPLETLSLGIIRSPLLYLAASALLVFGLVSIDRQRTARKSRLLGWAGGCSYVLYLIHVPLGSVLLRLFRRVGQGMPAEIQLLVMTAAAIVTALMLHLWFEKPVVRRLRKWLDARARLPEPLRD